MPRTKKKKTFARTPPLPWRETRIREWRDAAKLSQQAVSDALAEMGIELTRESVQRIENGKQKPLITTIEAMASLFGTDVTSLLTRSPKEAGDFHAFAKLDAQTRRLLLQFAENSSKGE